MSSTETFCKHMKSELGDAESMSNNELAEVLRHVGRMKFLYMSTVLKKIMPTRCRHRSQMQQNGENQDTRAMELLGRMANEMESADREDYGELAKVLRVIIRRVEDEKEG